LKVDMRKTISLEAALRADCSGVIQTFAQYLINKSKLLFSPGPGLGAPLNSYLEVALYKYRR